MPFFFWLPCCDPDELILDKNHYYCDSCVLSAPVWQHGSCNRSIKIPCAYHIWRPPTPSPSTISSSRSSAHHEGTFIIIARPASTKIYRDASSTRRTLLPINIFVVSNHVVDVVGWTNNWGTCSSFPGSIYCRWIRFSVITLNGGCIRFLYLVYIDGA